MKEITLKLDHVVEDDNEDKLVYKHYYHPAGPHIEKKFEVQIVTSDPFSMTQNTGFPREKGDTVTIVVGSSNRQSKLEPSEKEVK